jgi:hypothetical protein
VKVILESRTAGPLLIKSTFNLYPEKEMMIHILEKTLKMKIRKKK